MRHFCGLLFAAFLLCYAGTVSPALAAMSLIRDTEIEATLHSYMRPLSESAGLDPDDIDILIVNDPEINAFVAGGNNIFIHTGLIMESERPEMVLGVMAHELGHIRGGHLVKTGDAYRKAGMGSVGSMLLAGLAAAAGAGSSASAAIATVGSQFAERHFYAFSRTQEQIADQAAMQYLTDYGVSTDGLIALLEKLRNRERLHAGEIHSYLRTHPLSTDRISQLRRLTGENTDLSPVMAEEAEEAYQRMRAKFTGFLLPPEQTFRRYPETDHSFAAEYARAIAYYRASKKEQSLDVLARLRQREPANPYLMEMQAQLLFEHGDLEDAITMYRKALSVLPHAPLIQFALGQALLATGHPDDAREAIIAFKAVLKKEPEHISAWRGLSGAYRSIGDEAGALRALAEALYLAGDYREALQTTRKAQSLVEPETPDWYRVRDLQLQAQSALKEQKK